MNFISIVRDPNGIYVGCTADGWLWYYIPAFRKWFLIEVEVFREGEN